MREQTTSEGWVLRLGAGAGIVGALIGMVGNLLHPAVPTGDPEGIARTIAGITVGLILVTVDGLAAKHLADAWAAAPPEEEISALRVVLAEETINFSLAALFNILFAGVTFVLYGLAVAWSRVYPRWLGWVVVVAGGGSVVVGLVQAYVGESTGVTRILTIVFPTVITLWLAVMGVLLLRRASSLALAVGSTFDAPLQDGGGLAASEVERR